MTMEETSTGKRDWVTIHPWHLLALAGMATILACPALRLLPLGDFPGVVLLLAGFSLAGGAVVLSPGAPLVLVGAGLISLAGTLVMRPEWDSVRMVGGVLTAVAGVAALLVSLPLLVGWVFARRAETGKSAAELQARGVEVGRGLSRAAVSVLVLAHFSGVLSSWLSVPPPGRPAAWLPQLGWSWMQPYLQFAYLTNAYRFYSPEPGPPSLLWFYVSYSDGSIREIRIPNMEEHKLDPLNQEYTRRLTLGESVNQRVPVPTISDEIKHRRIAAGNPAFNRDLNPDFNKDLNREIHIPLHPRMPAEVQYQLPAEHCRRRLGHYARHIAVNYPSEQDPSAAVTGVKIYRVTHQMLDPPQMADPRNSPTDDWTYQPYYQGEYTKEGVLKDPKDPFLFWLIPIFYEDNAVIDLTNPQAPPGASGVRRVIRDCLKDHVRLKTKAGGDQP